MRLYLARHAQTLSNVTHALDTAYPGAALTGLGQEQAARLAARLAGEPLAVVAASPLLRAQQTAAALAAERDLEVLTLDGLREVDAGDLEMQTAPEAIEGYIGPLKAWAAGDLDATIPGGPSGHEFLSRFDDAVRAIAAAAGAAGRDDGADGLAALAVSHGAAIRSWSALRCRNADSATVSSRYLANTDILVVEGSPGSGWLLDGWLEEPAVPDAGQSDPGALEGAAD
jgi:probable phosphoglycerate mutase